MSGLPWFRLYHEMLNDPKVGTLNDAEFRTWIELLCIACEAGKKGDTGMSVSEIEWKLRRNVSETLQKLLLKRLVTEHETAGVTTLKITNWEKRQFSSDCSTDRVRKHRKNNNKNSKNETFQKRFRNVSETPPDTDTDTDTDKEIKESPAGVLRYRAKDKFMDDMAAILKDFGLENGYAIVQKWRQEYQDSQIEWAITELAETKDDIKSPFGFVKSKLKRFLKKGQVAL